MKTLAFDAAVQQLPIPRVEKASLVNCKSPINESLPGGTMAHTLFCILLPCSNQTARNHWNPLTIRPRLILRVSVQLWVVIMMDF